MDKNRMHAQFCETIRVDVMKSTIIHSMVRMDCSVRTKLGQINVVQCYSGRIFYQNSVWNLTG